MPQYIIMNSYHCTQLDFQRMTNEAAKTEKKCVKNERKNCKEWEEEERARRRLGQPEGFLFPSCSD